MATHARPRAFTTQKKGENYELRSDLNSDNKDKRKDTVKKVIANMTVGKDVSGLFPDVLKNMQTDDLELKKLVYLYLMNYAKTNPELVILAVNTFVKDTDDINPLIRALAIRTMACIRVDKMIDYIGDPLRKCLKDDNPYVRKTAAMCVAKFYDLSPRRTTDDGFVAALQDLMSDSNPMVVANALTSLMEIKEASSKKDIFNVSTSMLNKLLAALNECTEWGQISILTALANYTPQDSKEAETICERVMPRLQHANGSVVLSAVKVLMIYMRVIRNEEFIKQLVKKMAPPLVTLLASAPEVQYVALRNINLILQKRPDILSNEVRVFFCKYNDPPYVKLEKLEVMIKLCSDRNVDQLLSELKEYANEVDVDFVRKSVRAIGRCAIKIDDAAERCVNVLLELISTKVNYVVQEAIVVIKDIFRKYPHKYEGIIPTLCENLDALDEPEAKGSLIWIIGEYAERIENADELIESFMEFFKTENPQVQLQIVSSTVKLFLKKPSQSQEIVQRVLQTATTNCDNPDIRDRAYIYWRLLSTDPQAAKAVVLADKPPIGLETNTVSDALLDELINNISTLASVYHKPPGAFLGNGRIGAAEMQKKAEEENQSDEETEATPGSPRAVRASANVENLLDLDFNTDIPVSGHAPISHPGVSQSKSSSGVDDLLDLLGGPTPAFAPSTDYTLGAGSLNLGGAIGDAARGGFAFPKTVFITAQAGKGLEVSGTFVRRSGVTCLDMSFQNKSMQPMFDFAIQFNKNSFGIASNVPLQVSSPLQPNKASEVSLPLGTSGPVQQMDPFNALQVAVKNNFDVFYFQTLFPIHAFFSEDAGDSSLFSQAWGNPNSAQSSFAVTGLQLASPDALLTALKNNNIVVVDQKGATFHASMKAANVPIAAELLVSQTEIKVSAKSPNAQYLSLLQISLDAILRS